MSTEDTIEWLKEFGGVFRFGSGVLGKSVIALGVLMVAICIAALRLKTDWAILTAVAMGLVVFLVWFWAVISFAKKHPDVALLEGGEWTGYQRFQASAKGVPAIADTAPVISPRASIDLIRDIDAVMRPDSETPNAK